MATPTPHRTLLRLLIGDDGDVTLRFKGSSRLVMAKALDVRRNDAGEPTYLCLDRLVHKPHEEAFRVDIPDSAASMLTVTGCVVTEIHAEH